MPSLFAGSGLLSRQLGSIGSLASDMDRLAANESSGWGSEPTGMFSTPSFTDSGLASTMLGGQRELGGLTKESWFGGDGGNGLTKERGSDLLGGKYGGSSGYLTGGAGAGVGQFTSGGLSTLNNYDSAFAAAGARYGIDPNWLKAIAAIEGHYDNSVDQYGAVGIMGIMPGGYQQLQAAFPGWQSDPAQNIMLGAAILADKIRANGGTIEGGIQGYLGWGTDAYGTNNQTYLQRAQQYYQQLQQGGGQFPGGQQPINGQWGGNPVGNSFVQAAMQFVGVDYVWGSIPGAGDNPWQTGWDCSGFTYYMSQKYGDGSIPMGSHYQYQYAQQTGQLFTNLNQLRPGDLVFIDTGWQGGAGAELNRAGHVGIYIGNGQMIHAANPNQGTIISPLSGYGGIMGAMHQSGSGMGPVAPGMLAGGGGNPLKALLDRVRGWQ